ncbi:hypothetical protein ZHAS_00019330 [Anopheles sinensis]|uniref:Uncharacterized protein n=1 Tax=Anopheles sinensis TaxID=74873 RepID=A0A084WM36_ANOSI|nr:hypothetical protein ZHAS_00019330 [Anopheles sinensis]
MYYTHCEDNYSCVAENQRRLISVRAERQIICARKKIAPHNSHFFRHLGHKRVTTDTPENGMNGGFPVLFNVLDDLPRQVEGKNQTGRGQTTRKRSTVPHDGV